MGYCPYLILTTGDFFLRKAMGSYINHVDSIVEISERPEWNFTETGPKPKYAFFTKPEPNWNRNLRWVLLAWISRCLDNLDIAISSLNLARFLKKYYAWYISWYILISCTIFLKFAQYLGWISHYLGCQDI